MRKFKLVFYPIYILTILFVLIISFDIMGTLEVMMKIGVFKYFSDLPYLGRNMLLFLSGLMLVELVVANFSRLKLGKSA